MEGINIMSKLTAQRAHQNQVFIIYLFIYCNPENVKNNIQIEDYNNTNFHSNEMQQRV